MNKSMVIALLVGAFFFAPASAKADFEIDPCIIDPSSCLPPPPPPDPSPDPEPAKSQQQQQSGRSKVKVGKIVAKIVVCTFGRGMMEIGKPLPLPKMSRRQRARFNVEVKFYGRAKLAWGFGCGLAPNPGAGVVVGAGGIGLMDSYSRFISGERPIQLTVRQEQLLFCRDGSSPCPSLAGVDPDMYGPK